MKKKDVVIGETYVVKVSGKLVPVRIERESPFGGWVGWNRLTRREVRIKTAARLRNDEATLAKYRRAVFAEVERSLNNQSEEE